MANEIMSCGWKFLVKLLVGWLAESVGLLVEVVVAVGIVGTEAALLRERLSWLHTEGLGLGVAIAVLIVELVVHWGLVLLGEIDVESSEPTLRLRLLIHATPLIAAEGVGTRRALLLL